MKDEADKAHTSYFIFNSLNFIVFSSPALSKIEILKTLA